MLSVLHVLLMILRILGISILIILALLLAVLLLVLFVPVRYKAKGIFEGKDIDAGVNVTWLFSFVHFRAAYKYSEPFHMRFRIIGIPIYDNLRHARNEKASEEGPSEYEPLKPMESESQRKWSYDDDDDDEGYVAMYEPLKTQEELEEEKKVVNYTINDSKVFTETDDNSNKESFIDKISDKFRGILGKIKFTFEKIYGIIKKVKANIDYYVKLINLESTKAALRKCKKQFVKLLKLLCPRKYKVNLHLGFEDPSTMGEVLAIWGMLYPLHMGKINIRPEFETAVVEGNFNAKGRICVISIIKAACILYFDKNIKLLIRRLKFSTNI